MAYQPGDLVNAIVHMTENYVRNRVGEFKTVSDLSVFIGRLRATNDISYERNMLQLYEDEIPKIHRELKEYLAENKTAVVDIFPTLKERIDNYLDSNPFDYVDEFGEHLDFDSNQKTEMERALEEVLQQ